MDETLDRNCTIMMSIVVVRIWTSFHGFSFYYSDKDGFESLSYGLR